MTEKPTPQDVDAFLDSTLIGDDILRILPYQEWIDAADQRKALELRSTLTQGGYRYGSGVRTMWFAPGRGLVKLTFAHRDGSTDTVTLIK